MRLTVNQYAKALYSSVKDKSQDEVDLIVANFLNLLQKNKQTRLTKKIVEKFSVVWNEANGLVEAEIVSRKELDVDTLQKTKEFIKKKYAAKEVLIKNIIDASIKGGIIIRVGDELMDASIERKLRELRNSLVT
jgi:F-type H+-transporting ATPase subunit delta